VEGVPASADIRRFGSRRGMTVAPLPPGCDEPGGAAEIETGLEQSQSVISGALTQSLTHLRRQRHVGRICKIPRLVEEPLSEIGRHHGIEDDIEVRLRALLVNQPELSWDEALPSIVDGTTP